MKSVNISLISGKPDPHFETLCKLKHSSGTYIHTHKQTLATDQDRNIILPAVDARTMVES